MARTDITGDQVRDYTITNDDISLTAGISGSKVTPNFGAQAVTTTSTISAAGGTLTGDLTLTDKAIKFNTNSQLTAIKGNALASASITYSLPANAGSNGQVLSSDGSGGLSWVTPSAGASFPLLAPDGSLSAPSYAFQSSPSTGLFYALDYSYPAIRLSTEGVERFRIGRYGAWFNNRVFSGAGTVSQPAYSFDGGSSSGKVGFYEPAYNELGITTDGFERIRVGANGNVGIGHPSPSYPLTVAGASWFQSPIRLTSGTPGVGKVLTSDAQGVGSWENPPSPNSITQNDSAVTVSDDGVNPGAILVKLDNVDVLKVAPGGTLQTVGGNARGANAVDLQTVRSAVSYVASGQTSVISGGENNRATQTYCTVSGGAWNYADQGSSTVSGGYNNQALGYYSSIGGGWNNKAQAERVTIGGGYANASAGGAATISGGSQNSTNGDYATVSGGQSNAALGDYSWAAGRRAKANNQGSFALTDSTDADFVVGSNNVLGARFSGGYWWTGGNVGIGNTDPQAKLDVTGDVKVSGGHIINSSPTDLAYSGVAHSGVAGEALAAGDLCYRKSDGKYWKANATNSTTIPGVVLATAAVSAEGTGTFLSHGFYRNYGLYAWTPGQVLYASTTSGLLTATAPNGSGNVVQAIGYAYSADVVYIMPSLTTVGVA